MTQLSQLGSTDYMYQDSALTFADEPVSIRTVDVSQSRRSSHGPTVFSVPIVVRLSASPFAVARCFQALS